MSNTKSFRSYPLYIDTLHKEMKTFGARNLYDAYNNAFIKDYGIEFYQSLDFENLGIEQGFVNGSRNYIFMDKEVINHLYSLKYKAKTMANLKLPFDSFAISPATDAKVGGLPVMPIMVVSSDAELKGGNDIAKAFGGQVSKSMNRPDLLFTITVAEDSHKAGNRLSANITSSELELILQQDLSDVTLPEIFDDYSKESIRPMNKQQGVKLIQAIKLVSSFLLYNQITQDKFLVDGFPEAFSKKPKRLGLMKRDMSLVRGCSFSVDAPKNNSKKSHHIRVGHYRQLMNVRYYQGEYENWERGSRWIPVNPSIIGGGEAHTQLSQ